MRRSRPSPTAWPAFADLMTIIAVVSLAIATGVLTGGGDSDGPANLNAEIGKLVKENEDLSNENEKLSKENTELQNELDDANNRTFEAESSMYFGFVPCLSHPASPTTAFPLLQIVANSGYVLTRMWDEEYDDAVEDIPDLLAAIEHGQMDRREFESYARKIYQYGDHQDTFGSSCRFFVELRNETDSLASFAQARAVVETYFRFSNPSEVIQIQKGAEGSADRQQSP